MSSLTENRREKKQCLGGGRGRKRNESSFGYNSLKTSLSLKKMHQPGSKEYRSTAQKKQKTYMPLAKLTALS